MIAIDPKVEYPVVLKLDEESPKEDQTEFIVRVLNKGERMAAEKIMPDPNKEDDDGLGEALEKFSDYVLGLCLRGWRNFKNADGNEVPFTPGKDGKPNAETLTYMPIRARVELAFRIIADSNLNEADRKNLPSPSNSLSESSTTTA